MSFARFSTDDFEGRIVGYVGEGRFTDDPLSTFGGAGVVEIPRLQELLHYICRNGFEHQCGGQLWRGRGHGARGCGAVPRLVHAPA